MEGKYVKIIRTINKDRIFNEFKKNEIAMVIHYSTISNLRGFNCEVASLDGKRTSVGNLLERDDKIKNKDYYHFILLEDKHQKTLKVLYG